MDKKTDSESCYAKRGKEKRYLVNAFNDSSSTDKICSVVTKTLFLRQSKNYNEKVKFPEAITEIHLKTN